jgi:hypothetical protein
MPVADLSFQRRAVGLAVTLALLGLSGCSYAYRNPAEALGPGEVGGRTVSGPALLIDGVAISVKGAGLDTVLGTGLDATSRANGRFAMLPLPVGRHSIMFRKGTERALQRDVEITYGKDGQPGGIWLGDVTVPAAVGLTGTVTTSAGLALGDNGIAVDEVSGAIVPVSSGTTGGFSFEGLSVGEHRVRVFASDSRGDPWVGGPAVVQFLDSDAGTRKSLSGIELRRRMAGAAGAGTVRLKFSVAGSIQGLALSDLVVTGLPGPVAFGSDGSAQVELPEGPWSVRIGLPAAVTSTGVLPPPPVTFVALAGTTVDLGTLYAVSVQAPQKASRSCHADADCAPGRCTVSHVCDADYVPPPQASASVPWCDQDSLDCTSGNPLSAATPVTRTCAAAPGLTTGVACGACCTPDGLTVVCGQPGLGGCPSPTRSLVCSVDRWCWEGPLPQGNALRGIWGAAARDLWAVGDLGTILHWDGSGWSSRPSGTTAALSAVWGSSATDAWAVGAAGTILHWNGTAWSSIPSGTTDLLSGVWGSSASDVWVVGGVFTDLGATLLHWNGAAWAAVLTSSTNTLPFLNAVWGSAASDVWAVGVNGAIQHFNGSGWSSVASGVTGPLTGVWGSSSTEAWAVGYDPVLGAPIVLRWDGSSWAPDTSSPFGRWTATWGPSAGQRWTVGGSGQVGRWSGGAWSSTAGAANGTLHQLNAAWGSSASDAWAVGDGGAILHWDGSRWSSVSVGTSGPNSAFSSVWGVSGSDVWTGGYDDLLGGSIMQHWNGSDWSSAANLTTGEGEVKAIWGSGADDVYAGLYAYSSQHWDGAAWTDLLDTPRAYLYGLWGSAANDIWAVGFDSLGKEAIEHWDGVAWTEQAGVRIGVLNGIWGSSPTDAWAVGGLGLIKQWTGTGWDAVGSTGTTASLNAISGTGPSDAWVVGEAGLVLHWDGVTWSGVPSGTTASLRGVWAANPSAAWAVGDGGTILRWDGVSWTGLVSGTSNVLRGVWGGSLADVWVVGEGATILHLVP